MNSMPQQIRDALAFLQRALLGRGELLLFGSQAREDPCPGADFDIGILGTESLPWLEFAVMKTRAEDLAWPWSIDLVDLHRVPEEFRMMVQRDGIPITELTDGPTSVA